MAKKIDLNQFSSYNFSKDMFEEVKDRELHDKKLETKPVGYFKDAFRRFCKNKSSVAAAIIILLLVALALFGPLFTSMTVEFRDPYLIQRLPKNEVMEWIGWDGCERKGEISAADYLEFKAIEQETGDVVVRKKYKEYEQENFTGATKKYFDIYLDSYTRNAMQRILLTETDYKALQKYQDDNNIQIIYPYVSYKEKLPVIYKDDASIYYYMQESGAFKNCPVGYTAASDVDNFTFQLAYDTYEETGGVHKDAYTSKMRIEGNEEIYSYGMQKQGNMYEIRVEYNRYYAYLHNGEMPCFLFGSDQYGKDIFVRLCAGARFSFLFAIAIAAINLTIGAIYGAIEGYYGGAADMIMERISDILSGVPFMVVVTLFKLHIMNKVGVVPTLLFAFVLTGWIGMASNTRMQFYRYKNQEYVLAARTLGASDARIMFKHIFPNALGTLITSCVLVIPGVIFSESSLSYLGIINLNVGSTTSIGTLLANGQAYLQASPHIIFFPAVFIALLEISFNLFGNGLRDAFNPSLRGSED